MATEVETVEDTATETTETTAATEGVDTSAATETTEAVSAATEAEAKPFALPDDFDWRDHFTGGDEKLLKLAGRYQSPKAMVEALGQLRAKLSSGKVIEPLGDDATDDEKAAYRKAMDIPDAPEAYLSKLPDGLVVGDDDRPAVDAFLSKMHASNAPQAVTNAALGAYYEIVEQQQAAQIEATEVAKRACEDALREEWATPGEYRRNDNVLQNYVGSLPEAIRDAFDKGIGPDGVPLGFNPEIRKWLVARALEENPIATVVPGAGANQASAIADEIATLEDFMGKNRKAWFSDNAKQERYRQLLDAQAQLKG